MGSTWVRSDGRNRDRGRGGEKQGRSRRRRKRKGSRRGREEPLPWPLGSRAAGGRAQESFPRRVLDHSSRPRVLSSWSLERKAQASFLPFPLLPEKEQGVARCCFVGAFRRCFGLDRFLRLSALVPLRAKVSFFWFGVFLVFFSLLFLSFFSPWVTFVNSVVAIVDHFTWTLRVGSSRATGSGHDALPR